MPLSLLRMQFQKREQVNELGFLKEEESAEQVQVEYGTEGSPANTPIGSLKYRPVAEAVKIPKRDVFAQ